jgi:hypothetical protein
MFFWENGFNLEERLVPPGLSNAASAAVEALKINSITEKVRRGRPVVVKRRNAHGEQMAELANFYFRTWNIPIRFLSISERGRRCFRRGDSLCDAAKDLRDSARSAGNAL